MPGSWRNAIVCASRVPSISFDNPVLLVFPLKIKEGKINRKYLNLASSNCLLLFLMWWFSLEHRGIPNCSVENNCHKPQLQMINSSKLQLYEYFTTDLPLLRGGEMAGFVPWSLWLDQDPYFPGSGNQGTDPDKCFKLDITSGWRQLRYCRAPARWLGSVTWLQTGSSRTLEQTDRIWGFRQA